MEFYNVFAISCLLNCLLVGNRMRIIDNFNSQKAIFQYVFGISACV